MHQLRSSGTVRPNVSETKSGCPGRATAITRGYLGERDVHAKAFAIFGAAGALQLRHLGITSIPAHRL
jgi:hypothetical protein